MSISLGQGDIPLSKEEKCSLYSVSSEDYFRCINKAQIKLFSQSISWWGWILILIIVIFGGYYGGPLALQMMQGQRVRRGRY
jgi:hypothetical protein